MSIESTFENELNKNGILVYKCKGVSMRPLIHQGKDVVIIEKNKNCEYKKLDVVLFKRKGANGKTSYILHRILKVINDSTFWIIGDNCITGDIVDKEDILGVMTTLYRKNKKITYKSFCYKLYVNFYCRFYRLRIFYLKCKHNIRFLLHKVKHIFVKNK